MSDTVKFPEEPRFMPLAGARNFRDIGGYATKDGRRVARGRVFRSGMLSQLTDEDQALIAGLGIRLICDFRANDEREKSPSRLGEKCRVEIWTRDYDQSAGDLMAALMAPGASSARSRDMMITTYRSLAYEQADAYRVLYKRIADGQLPLVFHCAAGKDRTGIAAALLLDVLGVPRESVVEDYALTDMLSAEHGVRAMVGSLASTSQQDIVESFWAPLMRADEAYIAAMFETIEAKHGSAEGFMREVLELDGQTIAGLRDRLLG